MVRYSPAGRVAAVAAFAIAVTLAACTDDLDPVRPIVAAPQVAAKVCIVTNKIGRLAYSADSATCSGYKASRVITTPDQTDNPGLYGIVSFHRTNSWEGWSPYTGAADLGATGVRIPVGWDALEPDINGGWNAAEIAKVHEAIDQYTIRGIDVYLDVSGTPVWAQKCQWVGDPLQWAWVDSLGVSCHQHPMNPPVDEYMARWTAAANFMVHEYGTMDSGHWAAKFFGYGNEPSSSFWPRWTPSDVPRLDKFVQMAQILATATHSVPGLKFVGPEANDGSGYLAWINSYMAQAASFTDIISFHAYRSPSTFERHFLGKGWGYGIQNEIKEVTDIANAYNKPMWVTEWGADSWTADPGIRRAVVWDVLQYQNRNPNYRLDRMFKFASFIPYDSAHPENSGPFAFGLMTLTPTEQSATDAYFCFGTIARLNTVPANGASCTHWNPPLSTYVPPSTPTVYSYITGPGELGDDEEGTFTTNVSGGPAPSSCSWFIDGENVGYGSCTLYQSWNDGPSSHTLTAIAYLGEEDIPSSDKPVTIYNGGCPTCNERKGRRALDAPAPSRAPTPSPAKRKPDGFIGRLLGIGG